MKTHLRLAVLVVVATALTYGAWLAMRAQSDLVTLNVRDTDVRTVVRQLEWQTWETIHVASGVRGRVTLRVNKMPLAEVLRIVGQQTAASATTVYPLYSSRASLRRLEKVVRGEAVGRQNGWKSWSDDCFSGFSPFLNNLREQNELVNARFESKNATFATLALSRFSQAQVVAEDGTIGIVTLKITRATLREAVAQVARQLRRKWTLFYVLSPGHSVVPVNAAGDRDLNTINLGYGLLPASSTNFDDQFAARLATLSPEERMRALQMRRTSDALRAMPEDRRRQEIQKAMGNQALQHKVRDVVMSRIIAGLREATPDQRVQASRALTEMQNR